MRTCSHAFQDKEVRETNLVVGVLTVFPAWRTSVPDDELAGTRNEMYPGRTYECINCGLIQIVPGKWRPSKFIDGEPNDH